MFSALFHKLAKAVGYCYCIAAGTLFIFQRKLQYIPTTQRPIHPVHLSASFAEIEEIFTFSADGLKLNGWHWPAIKGSVYANISILHLHGNAGNREHRLRWAYTIRQQLGCGITLIDYRGYGGNKGRPSEAGLILDAIAAIEWHYHRRNVDQTKLVLHLESIGSAVGITALLRVQPHVQRAISGIVVEGGLSSCIDIVRDKFRIFPLCVLMLDKWNNTCVAARQLNTKIRFMSLHGTSDAIVPLWCGRKLFHAVACEDKSFVQFNGGGHNDLLDQPTYMQHLERFYAKL
jgi:pimeloyl-ACP methyl ester carboxylesterase